MQKSIPTLIVVVGIISLIVILNIFQAVAALFGLIATQPFLLGLGVGVGGSALAHRRLLLRLHQLERQNRELEETVDRYINDNGGVQYP